MRGSLCVCVCQPFKRAGWSGDDSAAGAPEQLREMTQPREMTHPRTKVALQSHQFSASSSPDTPRTKVVLQSRQFSASSSPDTPRTKVVRQSRQFSFSSSPDTPRTKVVLQSRQFSGSSSTDCSTYYSCTTKSPVLIFQLPICSAY